MRTSLPLLVILCLVTTELFAQLPDTCWQDWIEWKEYFPPEIIRAKQIHFAEEVCEDTLQSNESFEFDGEGYVFHYTRTKQRERLDSDWFTHNARGQVTRKLDSTKLGSGWVVSIWLLTYDSLGRMSGITEHRGKDSLHIDQEIKMQYSPDGKLVQLDRISHLGLPSYSIFYSYQIKGGKTYVTSENTFGGRTILYLDSKNRLQKEWDEDAQGEKYNWTFFYDKNGKKERRRLKRKRFLPGTSLRYFYHSDGLIERERLWYKNYNFTYR